MQTQRGYIGMIIVFIFFLIGLILWPLDFSTLPNQTAPSGCQPNSRSQTITLSTGTFKPVLSNLYVSLEGMHKTNGEFFDNKDGAKIWKYAEIIQIDGKNYIAYQSDHALINKTKLKTSEFGLAFVIPLDADGKPTIIEKNNSDPGDIKGGSYLLSTVYQNVNNPTPLPAELLDSCGDPSKTKFAFPSQSPSADQKQLQLQYLLFQAGEGFWSLHCKPAIYLYPKEKTQINVKVLTKGSLLYTDPKYPVSGWDVTAFPDGKILYGGKNYPYLYYESKVPDNLINKPDLGYIISFDKLPGLYTTLLPALGLSDKQTEDFKNYWEKVLPYSPFYFVGIMSQDDINSIEPLEITPKPDYLNRVRLYFKALDRKPIQTIDEPVLPILRSVRSLKSNFQALEWGGMVKNNPLEPFTCSQ